MAVEASIPVPLLETLKETLTSAFYYSQVLDLADSYRNQKANPKWSPLTSKLEKEISLVQSFIELAQTEEAPNGDVHES